MFFVNPDPFLLPTYRMSPFTTANLTLNTQLPKNDFAVEYFDVKFGQGNWKFTLNGRQAIAESLKSFNLEKSDIVTILTTSQNFYISSCVTKTIEKFCQWNRTIVPETKVVLVNHEFGFPYFDMKALVSLGIPIIEDCCTTFFSQDKKEMIGTCCDFSVYSFPKFFPIQIGGLLVSNEHQIEEIDLITDDEKQYMLNVLSHQLKQESVLLTKRKEHYEYALSKFESLGFQARFQADELIVPYALLLKNNGILTDLNALKEHLNQNGIQNSVFYGEDAFFIPCHQNLSFTDIDFMHQCIVQFIQTNKV